MSKYGEARHVEVEHAAKGLRIALAGNPNSGKTTVFNGYTGARQHVGNYPGVTVDRKEGEVTCMGKDVTLVDLPGIYSLTAYSQEELVARRELSRGNVGAVIDIAEAGALDRNMLLVVQMLEMGIPVVLACNMMDEARKAGIQIDMQRLGKLLGIPVIPMVGRTGEGLRQALEAAVEQAEKGAPPPLHLSYGPDIDTALEEMETIVHRTGLLKDVYKPRWIALKILESDAELTEEVRTADPAAAAELEAIRAKLSVHVKDTLRTDVEGLIIDYRYGYIHSLLRDGVMRRDPSKDRLAMTDRLDRVLTNALLGPIIMVGLLFLAFQVTFSVGAYPQGWLEDGFAWLGESLGAVMADGMLKSLLVDGVIAGVGGVMSFVPLILIMFAWISLMEDSGYMARVAYMMDRIFRFFGLHGASVMPYVVSGGIAGGCAIPGAMATRTLRSPKERLATLLTLPYMACGAKLPVMLMLVGAFFPENAALVMFLVMLTGWLVALLVARLLRSTLLKGEATPFVMELPPYRMPTLFGMLLHCWERAWMYIKKAGTIILAISVLIWASLTFPGLPEEKAAPYEAKVAALEESIAALAEDAPERKALEEEKDAVEAELGEEKLANSVAGRLGKAIEPVTRPAGFNWRTDIALIAGIAAKEAVVGTLGTAYSMGDVDPEEATSLSQRLKEDNSWSKATALSLMLFVLCYSPCLVALVVIRQEAGRWAWMGFSLVFNTLLAYALAVGVYQVAKPLLG
ncbi:MAG: ferrous iron transport protein B [Desulfovibrio sp.]|jgi:ferrous iron transport protein B|nr:ferrous iron transport protein B [Desulfovibrio sp.]